MQNLHTYILILHPPNPFPCFRRLCCRSSSHHCLHFFLLPCGITLFPYIHVFLLCTTGYTPFSLTLSAMHLNTSTPSFHPCFLAFSLRTTLAHLALFFPLLAVILSPFTHHSFISISPKVIWVEHISYLPLLPQSLLKPPRRHSYLKIHPFFPSGSIHHSNY